MSADAELLKSLCLAPGPTGFEAPAQEVVRRRLAPLGEAQGDPLGNLWLDVGPAGGPQVVVTAHADRIGLIVTYVDDHDFADDFSDDFSDDSQFWIGFHGLLYWRGPLATLHMPYNNCDGHGQKIMWPIIK